MHLFQAPTRRKLCVEHAEGVLFRVPNIERWRGITILGFHVFGLLACTLGGKSCANRRRRWVSAEPKRTAFYLVQYIYVRDLTEIVRAIVGKSHFSSCRGIR